MLLIAGAALGFWLALDDAQVAGTPNGPDEVRDQYVALGFRVRSGWLIAGRASALAPDRQDEDDGAPADSSGSCRGRRPGCSGRRRFTTESRRHRDQRLNECGLFLLRHAAHGALRHAHAPGRRSLEALSPAQDAPLVAGDVRACSWGWLWACTGLYIISLFYRQDFHRESDPSHKENDP